MYFLTEDLNQNNKFKELLKAVEQKQGPIAISGLVDVEKMCILTAILQKIQRPICILTYNELQAKKLCKDLQNLEEKQ